jgi:hypothetical protein
METTAMQFDHSHKPDYSNLPQAMSARMSEVFYERRAAGLNVQFVNAGKLDEWSFATTAQRDTLTARLASQNSNYAVS